ncbi:MAG TPA: UDP-3-O-(3-hydroxymyristoyl)glucosamine N-acyltransferase [Planctomycetaceae bacterium]|jgi:UDP-3-O-[3-hydroxymyristoyl] glucosamine N-acyltransferase|nr:UDP-3-O-(3-hydroxymyristoyl)glucosamine N-acyltransferase [Planctomycetaceae bacterium]
MSMTVEALADWLEGEVIGDPTLVIEKVQSLNKAGPRSVTFFAGDRNPIQLKGSTATAILVDRKLRAALKVAGYSPAFILVDKPKDAFLEVAARFAPPRVRPQVGISPDAYVSATAQIGKNTNIHPGAHIAAGVVIGDNCDIHPGAVVGRGSRVGDDVVLHPHVVLYEDTIVGNRVMIHAGAVLGAEGFGYRTIDGRHERFPHFGNVRIEDDVEIGACTTIDRAMIDETVIGQGTKLDNLVQIGHNCEIGRHNLFASQVGLAGSVTTGDYVVCAGQVGIADHIHLGSRSVLGAKSGVHKDVPTGQRQIGLPAIPEAESRRVVMAQLKLPEMRHQLRALERQVEELSSRLGQLMSPSAATTAPAGEAHKPSSQEAA